MDLKEQGASVARHPWERARFTFFAAVLRDAGALDARNVIDVGAGDGWFARQLLDRLARGATVACCDAHYSDADLARLADEPGVTARREAPDGPFDLALLLDVIEHVEDDAGLLRQMVARVRPGGWVLVSVPAWPALYTSHDTFLHHHRRYTPTLGRRVVQAAGLTVKRCGGAFHALILPRALQKVRETLLGPPARSEPAIRWRHGRLVTGAVDLALTADLAASHAFARLHCEAPGLTWWALCRKP